jgi:hypothetical protein
MKTFGLQFGDPKTDPLPATPSPQPAAIGPSGLPVISESDGPPKADADRLQFIDTRTLQQVRDVAATLESRLATTVLRKQAVRYELLANDGRYCSPIGKVAIAKQAEMESHPLMWVVLPIDSPEQANVFFPVGNEEGERLKQNLLREVTQPDGTTKQVAYLPIHWEEAKTIKKRFPNVEIVQDGEVFRGASPRSLFVGFSDASTPKNVRAIENYSLKMHLSLETYNRLGGLGGNRDIDMKDAKIASMFSHVCDKLTPKLSPYVKWQGEDVTMAVKLQQGQDTQEIGMIFRRLNPEPVIPGFALYSPTTEPLPHLAGSSILAARSQKPKILAADAIEFYAKKNPGKSKQDGFVDLFVDPLLDIIMSMATQGMSMELHSQNFLMSFDPKTGATKNVTIRDLHGLNYDAEWRTRRGLPDLFTVDNLKSAFPDIQQKDIDAWFKRDGKVRDRYKMPGSLQSTMDFFSTMFWMNTLDSLYKTKYFSRGDVDKIIERIKDRVEDHASKWGVDLRQLSNPSGKKNSFWVAETEGVRGKILFRRPA